MGTSVTKRLLLFVACCAAGAVLVTSITVSCGTVGVDDACAQTCPDVAMFEARLAELENGAGMSPTTGVVGIGTIIAHTTDIAGSTSITDMRAAGFALCDGTTPESQGIVAAILTGPTPDLEGRFLRGRSTSGDFENDATAVAGLVAAVMQLPHTHTQAGHGHAVTGGSHVHGLGQHTHGMEHTHLTRIADSDGFCNANAVPGSEGDMSNQTDWNRPLGSGCHYTTTPARQVSSPLNGRPVTDASTGNTASATPTITVGANTAINNPATVDIDVSLSSTDSETRPANMSVVWMMRVR
jgi:hypothetical protein